MAAALPLLPTKPSRSPTPTRNTSPSIQILKPTDGTSVALGGLNLLDFQATVSDPEDGSTCCSVSWSSDLDGFIGGGAQFSAALSTAGTHVITATVTDSDGASSSDFITVTATNTPPTASIDQPLEGAILYRNVSYAFAATVHDVNEPLAPLCNTTMWTSSKPGDLTLTGCTPVVAFTTNGIRTLTLTAQDSHGATVTDSVTITVTDPPTAGPPIVTIHDPADGNVLNGYSEHTLHGTAIDPDGKSPLTYVWTVKDYYGTTTVIDNSQTVSAWIPFPTVPFTCGGGVVELRLTVTDPDGEIGFDAIDVIIGYPPC